MVKKSAEARLAPDSPKREGRPRKGSALKVATRKGTADDLDGPLAAGLLLLGLDDNGVSATREGGRREKGEGRGTKGGG